MTSKRWHIFGALAALLLGLLGPLAATAENRFVADLAELPLMPGLQEQTERRLVYEKPTGRIVKAVARGDVSLTDILAFYVETLPQLGWRMRAPDDYRREGEILLITITGSGPETRVRFRISPE